MHYGFKKTSNKKVQKVSKTKPPFLIQKIAISYICPIVDTQKEIERLWGGKFDQNYSKCKKS